MVSGSAGRPSGLALRLGHRTGRQPGAADSGLRPGSCSLADHRGSGPGPVADFADRRTDAAGFEPLSKAYGLPNETDEEKAHKKLVLEQCSKDACKVPMEIIECCAQAIDIIAEFAAKGSALAVSDAGCGAAICKGAMFAASLNIFINTKGMEDREYAEQLKQLEGKQAAAQEKAKSVEKALLDKYAQVKKHCVPPVARLYGDQCGGCNMSLPQVTLRKFKNDVPYIECENCGRMIIQ